MVFAATIIFFVGAVVVDLGLWLTERRSMQRAADFATLAGSLDLPADPDAARASALDWAERNGYTDGENGVDVQVQMLCTNDMPNPPAGVCHNPTPGSPSPCVPEVGCDSMRVVISHPGARLFSSIFGVGETTVASGAGVKLSFDVTPLDTVVLLDDTGSMSNGCNAAKSNPGCAVHEAKLAAHAFTDLVLGTGGDVSQVGYAPYRGCYNPPRLYPNCSPASAIRDLTDDSGSIHTAINMANAVGGTGTNLCLPFLRAKGMFDGGNAQSDPTTRRSVVILTDGDNHYVNNAFGQGQPPSACRPTTNPAQSDPDTTCSGPALTRERQIDVKTQAIVDVLKAPPYNAEVYVVAFGVCGGADPNQTPNGNYCDDIGDTDSDNTADRRLLKCIASSTSGTNDHYFEVPNASDLPEIFQAIAYRIAGRALTE